jgi:DNA-binding SARP family transcriptional activator
MLWLYTLGKVQIRLENKPALKFTSRKAQAALIYLACAEAAVDRGEIAKLLWEGRSASDARANLSVVLSSIRGQLGEYLVADRSQVGLNWDMPIGRDWVISSAGKLSTEEALELAGRYGGDFLSGFFLRDAAGFERWTALQAEQIRSGVIDRLYFGSRLALLQNDVVSAQTIARKLAEIEPLNESFTRLRMKIELAAGNRSRALEIYQDSVAILEEELGVQPSRSTRSLHTKISSGDHQPAQGSALSPLIGRLEQLEQIQIHLAGSQRAPVGIYGPGGIGKSTLAISIAEGSQSLFRESPVIVDCGEVHTVDNLALDIASVIGMDIRAAESLKDQLLNFLAAREFMLILDQVDEIVRLSGQERLAQFITSLQNAAPQVQIILTSREVIDDQEGHTCFLGGLSAEEGAAHFSQHARRVNRQFTLQASNMASFEQIWELTGGNPLALEYAANWTRSMGLGDILDELQRDIAILGSRPSIQGQERSLPAVFEAAWRRLKASERAILSALAVLPGRFREEQATVIAEAHKSQLNNLVRRSALRAEADSRLRFHTPFKQFVLERGDEIHLAQGRRRLTDYADQLCASIQDDFTNARQLIGIAKFSLDFPLLSEAWRLACRNQDWHFLSKVAPIFEIGMSIQARFLEWIDLVDAALESLDTAQSDELRLKNLLAIAAAKAHIGLWNAGKAEQLTNQVDDPNRAEQSELTYLAGCQGAIFRQPGETLALLNTAVEEFQAVNNPAGEASSRELITDTLREQGRYQESLEAGKSALELHEQLGNLWGMARSLSSIGSSYGALGRYPEAEQALQESLQLCEQLGDNYGTARALHNLGNIRYIEKDFEVARNFRLRALDICEDIGFRPGIASSLRHLGGVEVKLGNLEVARSYYRRALAAAEHLEARGLVGVTLQSLGALELELNQPEAADAHYRRSLESALETDTGALLAASLLGIALAAADRGQDAASRVLLQFVLGLSITEDQTAQVANVRLEALQASVSRELLHTEAKSADSLLKFDLDHVAEQVLQKPLDQVVTQLLELPPQDPTGAI